MFVYIYKHCRDKWLPADVGVMSYWKPDLTSELHCVWIFGLVCFFNANSGCKSIAGLKNSGRHPMPGTAHWRKLDTDCFKAILLLRGTNCDLFYFRAITWLLLPTVQQCLGRRPQFGRCPNRAQQRQRAYPAFSSPWNFRRLGFFVPDFSTPRTFCLSRLKHGISSLSTHLPSLFILLT
jgi:hypothetical protein